MPLSSTQLRHPKPFKDAANGTGSFPLRCNCPLPIHRTLISPDPMSLYLGRIPLCLPSPAHGDHRLLPDSMIVTTLGTVNEWRPTVFVPWRLTCFTPMSSKFLLLHLLEFSSFLRIDSILSSREGSLGFVHPVNCCYGHGQASGSLSLFPFF